MRCRAAGRRARPWAAPGPFRPASCSLPAAPLTPHCSHATGGHYQAEEDPGGRQHGGAPPPPPPLPPAALSPPATLQALMLLLMSRAMLYLGTLDLSQTPTFFPSPPQAFTAEHYMMLCELAWAACRTARCVPTRLPSCTCKRGPGVAAACMGGRRAAWMLPTCSRMCWLARPRAAHGPSKPTPPPPGAPPSPTGQLCDPTWRACSTHLQTPPSTTCARRSRRMTTRSSCTGGACG